VAFNYLLRKHPVDEEVLERRIEPHLGSGRHAASEVFDSGRRTIVDCAHVRVERLDTNPVLFSKVFKEFEDRQGQKYDYRYWAERENYFLREFLRKQSTFTHVVQARHLISENEAAKQVLTCDAGITVANWLRVRARYADTATLSHPFQRADVFLRLIRACLVALKQLHEHRIVHCDIKEDNICIPFAPQPFPGAAGRIHLEFGKLKLIDFAFSVAHSIPLTQILVINPDQRVPYQSELLVAALHADRRSGSPDAVQQLDYRVDLFSLGYIAEKISASGLDRRPGVGESNVLEDIHALVKRLKSFGTAPNPGPLPHDGLIAELDRLLVATSGPAGEAGALEFHVDGEWSAEEMTRSQDAGRKTPWTPVALPPPTLVSLPVAPVPPPRGRLVRFGVGVMIGLAASILATSTLLYRTRGDSAPPQASAPAESEQAKSKPAVLPIAESSAVQDGAMLADSDSRAARAQALGRLLSLARAGDLAAAQRVAAFEKSYDEVKQTVARSAWWLRGEGAAPEAAARWMENGALLADSGDRPAMLDRAFALGHGRALTQDRVASVETYLKVIDRSAAGDEISVRIRQSALRGLAAMLNLIVEEKNKDAAKRLLPALESKASSAAGDTPLPHGLLERVRYAAR
jgi:serine/threonine protein kinase